MTRRRALSCIVGGLASTAVAALLGACQEPIVPARSIPDARPTPTPLPSTPSRPTAEAKPAAQAAPAVIVKRGGSVVWATEADPIDLDPHGPNSLGSLPIWGDLAYQSLVMYDENLKITPALAESWTLTSPTSWRFKLREGVRHHDGNEVDAEDVRFWFDRLMAATTASPYRSEYGAIAKVEPRGRYEVEITLNEPDAPLLAMLAALRGSAIVSRRWLAPTDSVSKTAAVGSGPFRIDEYAPGSHVHYVRHADYWERGLPYLNEITLQIIPYEVERVDALRSGQVSYARTSPEAGRRLKSEKEISVLATPGPVQHLTVVNGARKPFDDRRVRQAISLAVDRRAVLDRVLAGEGKLTGPIPTGHGGWAMAPEDLPYQRDLKRAKALLAEANAADGFEAAVKVRADDPIALRVAVLMVEQVKEIGVSLSIGQVSRDTLARALDSKDFDLAFQRTAFLPDPDGYLSPSYRGGAPLNAASYNTTHFDELVDSARGVLDPGQRKRLYDEAVGLLLDDAPAIWWCTENNTEALHTSIKGYSQSYTGRRPFLKTSWLSTL